MLAYCKRNRFWVFANQISVTSKTGVGGTTAFKNLQSVLGNPHRFVSGGIIMRTFADGLGMSIEEFAAHNRAHPEEGYDKRCDDRVRAFARHNYMLGEGRLVHAFMPHAFNVLLKCREDVCSHRRWMDDKEKTYDDVHAELVKRNEDDDARYPELYPGCLWPEEDYHAVIDTEQVSKEAVPEQIISKHRTWLERQEAAGIRICRGVVSDEEE